MYNSKEMTIDEDLTFLSYNQSINAEFTVDEILDSDLWVIDDTNGLVKAVPLFNCDTIFSSNPNDKIVDNNKCIICNNDEDTVITVKSDDTGSIHFFDLLLHAYAPYTILSDKTFIYCIIYDQHMNTLNNITINVVKDNVIIDTVVTDHEGICSCKISATGVYKFTYNIDDDVTEESNTITINNGD